VLSSERCVIAMSFVEDLNYPRALLTLTFYTPFLQRLCNIPQMHVMNTNFIKPLTPELNPSVQRCLPRFLLWTLMFKGLNARPLYKSFGIKEVIRK
jgi:hypothetical protein